MRAGTRLPRFCLFLYPQGLEQRMPGTQWIPSERVLYSLSCRLLSTASFRDVLPGCVLSAFRASAQEEAQCSTSWLWDSNSSIHKLGSIKQAEVRPKNMHFLRILPSSLPSLFKKPIAFRVEWTRCKSWLSLLSCVTE